MIRRPSARSRARPVAVDPVAVLSAMSSAVGPSMTLPNTVGAMSTPLVVAVGTARRMWRTSGRASLSKTISWPRRGVTEAVTAVHAVDVVAVQAGGVDDEPGAQRGRGRA